MREQPEMSDPLADKLVRFTPDTTGLDRDALLFEAGRASAHPRRIWPIVAGLLALSQTATLVFFLTRTNESPQPLVIQQPAQSPSPVETPPIEPPSSEPRQWTYRRAILSGNIEDLPRPIPVEVAVENDGVLGVRSIAAVLDD